MKPLENLLNKHVEIFITRYYLDQADIISGSLRHPFGISPYCLFILCFTQLSGK